jgi:hypothetical protein
MHCQLWILKRNNIGIAEWVEYRLLKSPQDSIDKGEWKITSWIFNSQTEKLLNNISSAQVQSHGWQTFQIFPTFYKNVHTQCKNVTKNACHNNVTVLKEHSQLSTMIPIRRHSDS